MECRFTVNTGQSSIIISNTLNDVNMRKVIWLTIYLFYVMISDKGKLLDGKNDSIETAQQRGIFVKSTISTMGNRKSVRERKPNSRWVDYVTN